MTGYSHAFETTAQDYIAEQLHHDVIPVSHHQTKHITSLPSEVLQDILAWLPPSKVLALRRLCPPPPTQSLTIKQISRASELDKAWFHWPAMYQSMFPSVAQYSTLQSINLVNQTLSPIPTTLPQTLEFLLLGENRFTGPIPSAFGALTNLQELDLRSNQLSGEIPNELLFLDKNELSGSIPSSFGKLTSVVTVGLSGNQLTGPVPDSIGDMTWLNLLDISENWVSAVPDSIGQLQHLDCLYLQKNRIEKIPRGLVHILKRQWLEGTIPEELGGCVSLICFDVSCNRLVGAVPASLGGLARLGVLAVGGNEGMEKVLPREVAEMVEGRHIYLSTPSHLKAGH
ncbi:L domain-like protein [Rhizoclosmatium globosum]|uniref:L domain-like protein n=1 Tax=Rhizoclosmatium globosum TaxID=329046 RepID=A0A1Y2CZP7_9FUNG|nr:L domain-like protein [Rhizoclosmatium globosum]|eukprot:ORY52346.1 L domain-like protein [Rhizoclosmatium globosum]